MSINYIPYRSRRIAAVAQSHVSLCIGRPASACQVSAAGRWPSNHVVGSRGQNSSEKLSRSPWKIQHNTRRNKLGNIKENKKRKRKKEEEEEEGEESVLHVHYLSASRDGTSFSPCRVC